MTDSEPQQVVDARWFSDLNQFEQEANRLGKAGWQLFSFQYTQDNVYPVVAVWVKNYETTVDGYGRVRAKVVR